MMINTHKHVSDLDLAQTRGIQTISHTNDNLRNSVNKTSKISSSIPLITE